MSSSKKIAVLVGLCVALIAASATWAFHLRPCDESGCEGFEEWINGSKGLTLKSIMVGLLTGIVFGFVDNALMFAGIAALDKSFARLPFGEDPLVMAGYGNAFSSTVSAFVSTFIGKGIAGISGVDPDKAPLWAMAVGLLLGCVIGVLLPRVLLGRTKA